MSEERNVSPLLSSIHQFYIQLGTADRIDEIARVVLEYFFNYTTCQIGGILFQLKLEESRWQFVALTTRLSGQNAVKELKNKALSIVQITSGKQINQYDLTMSLKGSKWDWIKRADEEVPRTLLELPVLINKNLAGVIILGKFDDIQFTDYEKNILSFGIDRFSLLLNNFLLNQKITDEKEQLELMINNLNEGLIVIDDFGIIKAVNRALEHILDISMEDMLGRDIFDTETEKSFPNLVKVSRVATPENFLPCWEHRELCDRECIDCCVYTDEDKRCWLYYKSDRAIRHNCMLCIVHEYNLDIYTFLKQTKSEVNLSEPIPKYLNVTTTIFKNKNGNYAGELKVVRDITGEKQIEMMKDDFVATTSHELKTPLFSIRGFTQLLLQDQNLPKEQQQEFLQRIDSESQRLKKLVDSILLVSGADSGKIKLNIASFQIEDLVKSAILHTEIAAREKEIKVDYRIAPDVTTVKADQEKLEHCLINLIDNAIKFSNTGSIVQVVVENDNQSIKFQVSDQGIGVAPADIPKLFQRFSRIDRSDGSQAPGTGLGLYLCRLLIEAHGGKIWVESQANEGSKFIFSIPVDNDERDDGL